MNSHQLVNVICDYADERGVSFEVALVMLQRTYDDWECEE